MPATLTSTSRLNGLLGADAADLLGHTSSGIPSASLHRPGPNVIDEIWALSDRNNRVLRSLGWLYMHGRLGGTGYLSILPVDQGIEHSAGYAFGPNPEYFDPENLIRLAIEAGCNGFVTTFGGLGMLARKYAHRLPLIVKLNHNELLTYPNIYDMTMFANVKSAYELGAVGVGATVYFGSRESRRQIQEVSEAFAKAHELGMFTVLWCYLRNPDFKKDGIDYNAATDLTGQANHIGVTIEADIIKQKLPVSDGGFTALKFGMTNPAMYSKLSSTNPIDRVRYQVAHCYMGRVPLLNSGGASGENDLADVAREAVINKRAGGSGIIVGRKAFQRSMRDGIDMLNLIQDIYLDESISLA
jgi:class I fructose-bisphosphate aldolase